MFINCTTIIMSTSTVKPPYGPPGKGQYQISADVGGSGEVVAGLVDLNPKTLGTAVGQQDSSTNQWTEIAASTTGSMTKALAEAGWVQKSAPTPPSPATHPHYPLISAGLSLVAFEVAALIIAVVMYVVNKGQAITGSVGGDVGLWIGASAAFFGVNVGMQSIKM